MKASFDKGPQISKVFEAKFPSRCGACDNLILEKQRVRFIDNDLVHENCDDGVASEPVTGEVCPTCFTTKSVSGKCDNCE